jgi:hypothetical protein
MCLDSMSHHYNRKSEHHLEELFIVYQMKKLRLMDVPNNGS